MVALEFLLAVGALAASACLINVLGDWMAGREWATVEWGSILVVTLLGAGLFLIWRWNGALGVLAVVAGWTVIGILWDKLRRGQPDGPQDGQ